MKVKSESEVVQSCPTLSDPMDVAHQAPPFMRFSRQEYRSGVSLQKQIPSKKEKKKKMKEKFMGRHVGGRPRKVNKKQNITQGHGAQRSLFPAAYGGS